MPFTDTASATDHPARGSTAKASWSLPPWAGGRVVPALVTAPSGPAWTCPCPGVVFFSVFVVVVVIGVVVEMGWGGGQVRAAAGDTGARTRWPSGSASRRYPPLPPPPRLRPSPRPCPRWPGRPSVSVPCQALWAGRSCRLLPTSAFRPAGPRSLMYLKGPRCLLPAPQKASRVPTR